MKDFLVTRLAQHDARNALKFLVVDDQCWVHWIQFAGLFEVLDSLRVSLIIQKNCHFITYTTYFEGFERKGAAEVCMGVLRILFNHCIEILHSLIMLIDHLIRFGSLVEEPQITGDRLEALLEGED